MALIDTYRTSKLNKQNERAKLVSDKAKEHLKVAVCSKKINSARDAINRTKTVSTINSKLKEIDKSNNDLAIINKRIADLETKIAKKEKEVSDLQTKIDKEQSSIDKKKFITETKLNKAQERNLKEMVNTLNLHDRLHMETKNDLRELKNIPKKITVLFLASNPIDQLQLKLDEEARSIFGMIQKSRHRESVKFESCWALQTIDLLHAINEFNPTIVHFSGHGSDNDEIVFQTQNGTTKLVSKEAIVQTMTTSADNIRLVFFNTCFSHNQAKAISESVDAAIGMSTSIGDDAARVFSSQFYSAIGFGLSVGVAFQQARSALMLEGINEEDTPELFIREGLNENEIILVNPQITPI